MTNEDSSILKDAMMRAMISMAQADYKFSEDEKQAILDIYARLTNSPLTQTELNEALAALEQSDVSSISWLRQQRGALDKNCKEQIIKAAYLMLLSDGIIAAQERKKLCDIASAMDMPEIHFKAVLEEL